MENGGFGEFERKELDLIKRRWSNGVELRNGVGLREMEDEEGWDWINNVFGEGFREKDLWRLWEKVIGKAGV